MHSDKNCVFDTTLIIAFVVNFSVLNLSVEFAKCKFAFRTKPMAAKRSRWCCLSTLCVTWSCKTVLRVSLLFPSSRLCCPKSKTTSLPSLPAKCCLCPQSITCLRWLITTPGSEFKSLSLECNTGHFVFNTVYKIDIFLNRFKLFWMCWLL